MNVVSFTVQGSAEIPYKVTFRSDGVRLTASCTCPAGVTGSHCKHRIQILAGVLPKGTIENANSAKDLAAVQAWLPGTALQKVFLEALAANLALEEAKRSALRAKKKLGLAMRSSAS